MPTYDYVCDACDHRFELFQSIKADPQKKCPECSKPKLRRLIGPGAAIVFKGSGFYQTDYRSKSYQQQADRESKSVSESKSESGGKSESKGKSSGDGSPSGGSESSSKPSGSDKKKK